MAIPEVVAVDHRFDADGLYTLRSSVAAHANHLGAGPDDLERLLIVASELATNAIRHGSGSGRLRLWLVNGELRCQVSDDGPGLADLTAGTRLPEPMAVGGRGLWICRRLCDQLEIETGPDGTVVTAGFNLATG
jgi:anti-sigma regulatory factor (Ser/Thr protein kinase)